MLYAASKDAIKKTLKDGLSKDVQVNEIEDLRKALLYHDEWKMWSWKPGIVLSEVVSSEMINIVIDVELYFKMVIDCQMLLNLCEIEHVKLETRYVYMWSECVMCNKYCSVLGVL